MRPPRSLESAVLLHDLHEPIERDRVGGVPVAAHGGCRHRQRVEDRLFVLEEVLVLSQLVLVVLEFYLLFQFLEHSYLHH